MTLQEFTAYVRAQTNSTQDANEREAYLRVQLLLSSAGGETRADVRHVLEGMVKETAQSARKHASTRERDTAYLWVFTHLRDVLSGRVTVVSPPPEGQLSLWSEEAHDHTTAVSEKC